MIAGAMLLLLLGMWGGLLRLGWPWPGDLMRAVLTNALLYHGTLMVGGFLGTLISVERAVALGRWWCYGAPILSVVASVTLLIGMPQQVGALLFTLAGVVLIFDFVVIVRQQPATFTVTMGLGAAAWAVGNGLWLAGFPISTTVLWWIAFLVLTIVGERLELTRFVPQSGRKQGLFIVAAAIYLLGPCVGVRWSGLGWVISGVGLIVLALWLITFDLARRTVRTTGLTRFVAVCLLAGYGWLIVAGLIEIAGVLLASSGGAVPVHWTARTISAGVTYDALLHAVFLGFVFSMIFGHAPIIFPAVLNIRMVYHVRFYGHLLLLHLSVALRIGADLAGAAELRHWAGLLNVLAILLFIANNLMAIRLPGKLNAATSPQQARSPSSSTLTVKSGRRVINDSKEV